MNNETPRIKNVDDVEYPIGDLKFTVFFLQKNLGSLGVRNVPGAFDKIIQYGVNLNEKNHISLGYRNLVLGCEIF